MMTELAPPVASVVRSTSMSRPKGLIDNACLGVTMAGCSGVRAFAEDVSSSSRPARAGMSRIEGAPILSFSPRRCPLLQNTLVPKFRKDPCVGLNNARDALRQAERLCGGRRMRQLHQGRRATRALHGLAQPHHPG